MPGILISNLKNDCNYKIMNNFVHDSLLYDGYSIHKISLNKFLDDKVLYENSQYIIITEGIVLNKTALLKKYVAISFLDLIIKMMKLNGETFFREFRGSFSGAIYEKINKKWIIYTNHVGDRPFFYYQNRDDIIFSSNINYIVDLVNENNQSLTLNPKAFMYMLSFSFMIDDSTYANEVKRLLPGQYIVYSNNSISIKTYHRFNYQPELTANMTYDEMLNKANDLFDNAVKMEYDKDKEYGYDHLVQLSGGLDSRLNNFAVKKIGNHNRILNYTFCQSNYADEIIAKQISDYLGNEFLLKTMDNPYFLLNIDEISKLNFCLSLYAGITAGQQCLKDLDLNNFGILHTGQVGDAILGSFTSKDSENYKIHNFGAYSNKLLKYITNDINKSFHIFENNEIFLLYTRGFLGCMGTHLLVNNYLEIISPFLDVDFIEFCESIPIKYRENHKFYFDFIKKFYPDMCDFVWEKIGFKPTNKYLIIVSKCINKLKYIISSCFNIKSINKNSMNPFEYWYRNKLYFKNFIDVYLNNNIGKLDKYSDLKSIVFDLLKAATVMEKLQICTMLKAFDIYKL